VNSNEYTYTRKFRLWQSIVRALAMMMIAFAVLALTATHFDREPIAATIIGGCIIPLDYFLFRVEPGRRRTDGKASPIAVAAVVLWIAGIAVASAYTYDRIMRPTWAKTTILRDGARAETVVRQRPWESETEMVKRQIAALEARDGR